MKAMHVILITFVVLFTSLVFRLPAVMAAEHSASFEVLASSASEHEKIPVVLFLDNRLTMDDVYPVALELPMNERRVYVVKTLKLRFAESGSSVMNRLELAKKEGKVGILRPLWIVNAIRMTAEVGLITELESAFPNINFIAGDPSHENTLDDGWGLIDMAAPAVWTTYGADGSGVIVGHKDAGLDVTHPGFQGHLWINPGEDLNHNGSIDAEENNGIDDDFNGYIDDFNGWNFDDDNNNVSDATGSNGHGTKTASVISSNFTPCDTISVAPGAKLMELSAWLGQGAIWEASQYAVEMGALVISSSVSLKFSDCGTTKRDCPNYVVHRFVSEMELAAGLIHANSTGNGGYGHPLPAPSNCPPPAMTAAHPIHGGLSSMVSVAGYNQDGSYYTGSGHGPEGWSREDMCIDPRMPFCAPDGNANQYPPQFNDYPYQNGTHAGLSKPDFAAPTNTASLAPGGQCGSIGGTSGATPHVGAALALIYSAFPGITPEDAYLLFARTALDAGNAGFDSFWGFGKIRPVPACAMGVDSMAHVFGVITDLNDGAPLPGVRVWSDSTNITSTTADGRYELWFGPGDHTVYYRKNGYQDSQMAVTLAAGQLSEQNLAMSRTDLNNVMIIVHHNGARLGGIPFSVLDIPLEAVTNDEGTLALNLYSGTHTYRVGALPWDEETGTFTVVPGPQDIMINLHLSPRAQPSGPDTYGYYIYDDYDIPEAAFEWVEINPDLGLPGTNLNMGENTSIVQNLPFTFVYYGENYTAMSISSNGFLIMGNTTSQEWGAYSIPDTMEPDNLIAPFFEDWSPQSGGRVLYYSDPENHRVIVEWYMVPEYFSTCTATFEVILYDPAFVPSPTGDGVMRFQYNYYDRYSEGAIGIENADGTVGLEYMFQVQLNPYASPITAGRSLLITTEQLSPVSKPDPAFPREFVLEPNYPNPFNPSTTFAWTLPKSSAIKLALYNLLGQQVAVIAEGFVAAGRYEKTFSAESLTSGLYFAKLESEGKIVGIQKVVLLK